MRHRRNAAGSTRSVIALTEDTHSDYGGPSRSTSIGRKLVHGDFG